MKKNNMSKKKLQLEILDKDGNVIMTHHFFYNQYYEISDENTLRLSVTDNTYMLDKNGKLLK